MSKMKLKPHHMLFRFSFSFSSQHFFLFCSIVFPCYYFIAFFLNSVRFFFLQLFIGTLDLKGKTHGYLFLGAQQLMKLICLRLIIDDQSNIDVRSTSFILNYYERKKNKWIYTIQTERVSMIKLMGKFFVELFLISKISAHETTHKIFSQLFTRWPIICNDFSHIFSYLFFK